MPQDAARNWMRCRKIPHPFSRALASARAITFSLSVVARVVAAVVAASGKPCLCTGSEAGVYKILQLALCSVVCSFLWSICSRTSVAAARCSTCCSSLAASKRERDGHAYVHVQPSIAFVISMSSFPLGECTASVHSRCAAQVFTVNSVHQAGHS
jgi:hypothetical protein